MNNLSAVVAKFAADFVTEDLPASARHATARSVLDGIGVMAAASGVSDDVRPFVKYARTAGSAGSATIIGTGASVSPPLAAFANGAMAHALDFEDVFDAAPCHPNASALPAGLAIAAHRPVNGREFLAAVASGCEIVCRAALSVGGSIGERGWYPPPILGSIGAAVVVGRLLGGGRDRLLDTLSLLLMQLAAPAEIGSDDLTTLRATRDAFPAQAAVTAGLLAEAGVRGIADPLGGRSGFFRLYAGGRFDDQLLRKEPGTRWHIEDLSFKPWPSCRGTHAAIEIALELVRESGIRWQDIAAVECRVGALQAVLAEPIERKRAPLTVIDAKFSLPFSVAIAFVRGGVTLDDFDAAALADRDVLTFAKRVDVDVREDFGTGVSAGLRVVMADGTSIDRSVDVPSGSPGAPMSDDALVRKFVDCCSRAARPPAAVRAREFAERGLELHREPNVGGLLADLFGRGGPKGAINIK